ncbi:MAG: SDR family oxidoreductase, partial [Clostridia bacterium]|nr:SDR family oxidoreductase [Clostridia bacterium]
FGKIDILINNAALWRQFSSFVETDIDIWKKFININIMGTVYFTKAVINKMIENNYGRIINVASVAGVYGNATMTPYSATKGAVISFTKALAKEVAQFGITVNAVSPGSVSPADNRDIDFSEPSGLSFMGRTGTGRENADLICFLASEEAGYISGQNIQIDGCRKKQ